MFNSPWTIVLLLLGVFTYIFMKGFIKGFINSWRNNSTYTWEFYSYDQETDIKTELIINFTGSEEEAMKTLDLAKEYLHSFEQKLDDKD